MQNAKELIYCHCRTNTVPLWIFVDLKKPEVRPGAPKELESLIWLATSAVNAATQQTYIHRQKLINVLDADWHWTESVTVNVNDGIVEELTEKQGIEGSE